MGNKREIAVGIIGAGGNIGSTHSHNIASYVEGARLEAVYDVNAERARAVADKYGARIMETADTLIGSPEVDAVIIASWDNTHAEYVLKCIKEGKPVFCEKPLASNAREARAMIAASEQYGVTLMEAMRPVRFTVSPSLIWSVGPRSTAPTLSSSKFITIASIPLSN